MLKAVEVDARVIERNDERLDRRTAGGLVHGRPHDDVVGARAGGDEDLRAVDDVLVAIELRGRGHGGRVRTERRLGDGHRGPHVAEALELLVIGDSGDGGVTEALVGDRQGEPDVAEAGFHDIEQRHHVAAVLVALGLLVAAAALRARSRLTRVFHRGHEVGEGVELDWVLVLGEIVLARHWTEDLRSYLVRLILRRLQLLRKFEIDHC